jgi:Leucine-rich repeat (LRR) protein
MDTEKVEEIEETKALTYLRQLCKNDSVSFEYRHGAVATLRLLQLQILPASIAKFEKLKELKIGSYTLTSLPPEIGKLSQLSSLTLHDCQMLRALPPQKMGTYGI